MQQGQRLPTDLMLHHVLQEPTENHQAVINCSLYSTSMLDSIEFDPNVGEKQGEIEIILLNVLRLYIPPM